MGNIQKQSIRSTVIILIGFAIGAFNMLVLSPKILTTEQLGLTRAITDAGLTLATLCTLGTIPVIYKFFPFFKGRLESSKNDLPFITGMICLLGFIVISFIGYNVKGVIVRKFSERSPLFVEFSYLVYPFCFCILAFMWLESFAWSLRKSVTSNTLKELVPRVIFTILLIFFSYKSITPSGFFTLFSLSYLVPALSLFIILRATREFLFVPEISLVTLRLKDKMANFGLFVFGSQFLNLLSRTVDTFILTSKGDRGLTDTAVFTIATYIVTLMEVPQRSMNAVAIPILAESWKNKDIDTIRRIYTKSVSNLLLVGLIMFALIWLNIHNISVFLGKNFSGIESVILFMGIGKLVDLGTGANSQIIGTSSYWRVDFTTNVFYTLVALPMNYLLITKFGLMGAAYSSLITLTFYNALRYGFLWFKFGMQPYTFRHFWAIMICIGSTTAAWLVPKQSFFIVDAITRSTIFMALFLPAIYYSKISLEVNGIIEKYIGKIIPGKTQL